MSLTESIKSRRKSLLILVLIIALVLTATFAASAVTAYGLTVNYWQVKLGDKVVATVATEAEAESLIQSVKDYYVDEGDMVTAVTVDPEMKAEMITVKAISDTTELTENPQKIVDELVAGNSTECIYTVRDGDTLWNIAIAFDTDIASIQADNPDLDIENIAPGDKILFRKVSSNITVTTQQQVTSDKALAYDTVYEDTDELYEGEEEIATPGVDGSRRVVELVVEQNGAETSRTEMKSVETAAPVAEVIRRGTKVKEEESEPEPEAEEKAPAEQPDEESSESHDEVEAAPSSGSSVSNTNNSAAASEAVSSDIASATLSAAYSQIGVWQDCTSLVSNSLAAAGIYFRGWPQQYASLGSWTTNPVPGDIIIYSTHVAVYAGGGMAVHGGWCGGTTALGPVSCSAAFIGYIHIG